MAGFSNDIMYADNVNFGGGKSASVTTDGQLLIGSTASPNIRVGNLTSPDSSISISYSAPNIQIIAGGALADTYIGNTGTANPAGKILNVIGNTTQGLSSTGSGNTLTFTAADWTTTQKGVGVLATNAEAIAGSVTNKAITPDDLKAKLGTQTNHGVLVGAGQTAAVTALAVGTNGQLLIGATGANPAFATLTSTAGSLTYTTGANSLNIDITNYVAAASFTPTIDFGGGTTGITYATQVGYEYRIGNAVFFFVNINLSNKGSSTGTAHLNLNTATGANGANIMMPAGLWSNITLSGGYTYVAIQCVSNNSAQWVFNAYGSGIGATQLTNTAFANNSSFAISGCYLIA